mmetsp:Transcript_20473/g.18117  ORF Transcript_20473/g.18117 Transcript_20473/m.18117 type:complete len:288 (-) Transcript_20473:37-900(-)
MEFIVLTCLFAALLALSKTFYKPPMKKEDDKFIELSEDLKNYQCHDIVSLSYSLIIVALFLVNFVTDGVDFERKGTKIEKYIIIIGITWYSFDIVLKYYDGIHRPFVWIHHVTTITSLLASGYSSNTHCLGATSLFQNDAFQVFLIISRTFENINYPQRKLKYRINFSCLVLSFVLTRVFLNHYLIYKSAMLTEISIIIIIINALAVAFGTLVTLKMISKLWKYIPQWCRDPEKVQKNKVWSSGRQIFQMYKKNGGFSKVVNSGICTSAIILPISLHLYIKMNQELI